MSSFISSWDKLAFAKRYGTLPYMSLDDFVEFTYRDDDFMDDEREPKHKDDLFSIVPLTQPNDAYGGLFVAHTGTEVFVWDNDSFRRFIKQIEQSRLEEGVNKSLQFKFGVSRLDCYREIVFDEKNHLHFPYSDGPYWEYTEKIRVSDIPRLVRALNKLAERIENHYETIRREKSVDPVEYGRSLQRPKQNYSYSKSKGKEKKSNGSGSLLSCTAVDLCVQYMR